MFPWLSFLSYVIIVTYTPGPNNVMAMNCAKSAGFRKSLSFIAGVFTGGFIVMLLCLLFSAFLYNLVPKIQLPMKILGALYMLYLVIKILMSGKKSGGESGNVNTGFLIGTVLQLINPKLIFFGISVMSVYILPYHNQIPVLIFFAFFMILIGITANLCWAAFGSLFSMLFSRHGKILNIVMALLLLYCIVSLFI